MMLKVVEAKLTLELDELITKIEKLQAFINSDDFTKKVPDEKERVMMHLQEEYMSRYIWCLEDRLAYMDYKHNN